MTFGGETYGGAAYGSTETSEPQATATATASTTATTTVAGTGAATTTETASTSAETLVDGAGTAIATALPQTTASTTTTSAGLTSSTASAVTTAATIATDAASDTAPIEFRVTRDGTEVEDAVFDVDPLTDTANPFGDYAVIKMDDRGGEKFQTYGRGTRVDVAVSENFGITYQHRFTGYVVERRETEQSGADVLEVEAYSFDQFLRRNTVTNDQTGNLISEALADIIPTDTPVTYDAGNIAIGDDQELTRSYQGEPVENVLRDFAFKSNNENFGVNDDLEFFFRPRETVHIDRGVDNTQWFNYDIPELGKEAINEVEVWFDDGEESVIVDDGTDKLDLQDSLGLPDPGTQRKELQRPLITDINDAEDIGRKYLAFRNATLSGTVTTFGLYDAEPGDTIDVTIDPRGIDEEFVIAAVEYRWGVDETILTIVEKRGDIDDILSELSESVQRQEMNGANRDAPKNRITTTNATAIVDITTDADGNTPDADRFVNDGRNAVREAWTGDDPPDIDTLVVGDSNAGLSRSNTALSNQTNSAAITQSLPDSTSVEFSASITQTGVREVGLLAADGTLIVRATFETAVDLDGTVTVTLDVSNDDSVSRGVLTNDGQTAVRDVLADNTPAIPTDYAYGSDDTAVLEGDTALGNELVSVSLDEILIQSATSTSDFEGITDPADTDPAAAQNDNFEHLQECFHYDPRTSAAGDADGNTQTGSDSSYADTNAARFAVQGQNSIYRFTPGYTIDASNVAIQFRCVAIEPDAIEIDVYLNDTRLTSASMEPTTGNAGSIEWRTIGFFVTQNAITEDLIAGEEQTLTFEATGDDAGIFDIDRVAIYDDTYEADLTFDNTVDGNSQLSGPEFYANSVEQDITTANTRRPVTEADINSTWNNVTNGQWLELAIIDDSFERTNNSETASINVADGDADTSVQSRVSLSRYGTSTSETPTEGRQGQAIESWELTANPDAVVSDGIGNALTRAIVPPNTSGIVGQTVREAGIKNGSTLLTRHVLAEFQLLADQRLASSETTLVIGDN